MEIKWKRETEGAVDGRRGKGREGKGRGNEVCDWMGGVPERVREGKREKIQM